MLEVVVGGDREQNLSTLLLCILVVVVLDGGGGRLCMWVVIDGSGVEPKLVFCCAAGMCSCCGAGVYS